MKKEFEGDQMYMLTASGRHVNPIEPVASTICIEDIAHHLSIINRWTGASREPYSIAEHSVWCSRYWWCAPILGLACLLHDAHEAYHNDLNPMMKQELPFYVEISRRMTDTISVVFDCPPMCKSHYRYHFIKEADLAALAVERRDLMPHDEGEWDRLKGISTERHPEIVPRGWQTARALFKARFNELMSELSRPDRASTK